MPIRDGRSSLKVALTTSITSAIVAPLVGLASVPILTHALGVAGRGEVAAAVAPNVLILAIAAMGLPESVTYHLATRPHRSQRAFLLGLGITWVIGTALAFVCVPFLPFLSGGDESVARITLIATAIAVPALGCAMLRSVAAAQQNWYRIAVEKATGAIARLIALVVLAAFNALTVETAVLVICLAPFVSNIVYVPVLRRTPARLNDTQDPPLARALLGYGLRSWVGSIAGILLSRVSILFFTPLSNTTELGLYVVAVTIADVPVLLSMAVKDALFGVNARSRDVEQFAAVCRVGFLLGVCTSLVIAVTLPLWIGALFGEQFRSGIPTAWILLGCAVLNVPTFMLAAGTGAWGRPGIRSVGLLLTLAVDVAGVVILVPIFGAAGGASANLVSAAFGMVYSLVGTSRVMSVPARSLLVPRRTDISNIAMLARGLRPIQRFVR